MWGHVIGMPVQAVVYGITRTAHQEEFDSLSVTAVITMHLIIILGTVGVMDGGGAAMDGGVDVTILIDGDCIRITDGGIGLMML